MSKPIVIGHRGAAGHYPENTIISFQRAIEMGADAIEFDVHLSKDNVLVVCHDESIDRTTDGKGLIKDLTYQELGQFNAANLYRDMEHQLIPSLDQVMELAKDSNIMVNIELKSGVVLYPLIEEKVAEAIEKFDMVENTIVSSFNHYSLLSIKKINPRIKIGLLYMAGLVEPWHYAARIGAEAIHPLFFNIVPQVMSGCKESGIMVNPFTVNNEDHMRYMIGLGVSGIITDYPDRLSQIIKGK